ncbi:hypothetical protein P8605_00145 [Streptomyces sp. T-3]|nr:hypothetical protein [Streptomyces sp. T-3]
MGLYWNSLAGALFVDFGALPDEDRTSSYLLFMNKRLQESLDDPKAVGREIVVASLRLQSRRAKDTDLTGLIRPMLSRSPLLRELGEPTKCGS